MTWHFPDHLSCLCVAFFIVQWSSQVQELVNNSRPFSLLMHAASLLELVSNALSALPINSPPKLHISSPSKLLQLQLHALELVCRCIGCFHVNYVGRKKTKHSLWLLSEIATLVAMFETQSCWSLASMSQVYIHCCLKSNH